MSAELDLKGLSSGLGSQTAPAEGSAMLEAGAPDLDRVRRLAPTARQSAALEPDDGSRGVEPGIAAPLLETDRPSRVESCKDFMRAADPRNIEGPKLPLLVFGLSALLAQWDDKALSLAAPEIQAEFGLSVVALVTISSYVAVTQTVLGLPLGYLADRVKRVWLVRIGEILGNIGDFVQALAPSFGVLVLGRSFGALARGPGGVAQLALLADYYPSRSRARVVAFRGIMGQIGTLISIPIVGFMLTVYGWRLATVALGIMATIVGLLTFLLKEPVRGAVDRLEMGASMEQAMVPAPPPSFSECLRGAWAIRTLRLQAIASFVLGLSSPVMTLTSLILARKFALDPFQRSLILEITTALSIPALLISGLLADRLLAKRPSTVVTLQAALTFLQIPMLLIQSAAPNLWFFVIPQVIVTVVSIMLIPASITVMSLVVPARYRATGMQIFTPFHLAGMLLGPALTALAVQSELERGLLYFIPPIFVGGLIYLAASGTVASDIRTARAASMAHQESERAKAARQNKILVCRAVGVRFDDVQILFNVDLDVREGEIVALVGTNGAGKSTLLRAICGLAPAADGAIYYDGRDITNAPAHENAQRGVVYMPGGQGVFPLMTVRDNLRTAQWLHRSDRAASDASGENVDIDEVLEMFPRLRERLGTQAGTLSGGEQQMLALSQAFLMRPKLLMIDELSLGLAPAVVEQLLESLRVMQQQGITIVLVEQSLNVALAVADRAVFMERGTVQFDGPTAELLARPDLVRAVFMGSAGGAPSTTRPRERAVVDNPETLLRADGLTISYGGMRALNEASLSLVSGEIVGIIGPNGAGKTTLFDALSGYSIADAGTVHIGDCDVTSAPPDARARLGLGRAFQNARLFPPLTVRETVCVAMERRAMKNPLLGAIWAPNVRRSERKLLSRVDGLIELLGLAPHSDKFIRELSTGTRRAVEVACQMAAEPKVLLLDEPSSGLAQAEVEALGPALTRIVKETDCALLVIEHDLALITSISDRLIAMELGSVLLAGSPAEVLADPNVLRSYLSASPDFRERSGPVMGAPSSAATGPEVTSTYTAARTTIVDASPEENP